MRKSVFILSIHALCAIVLLAAQVLLAEVSATFTATVGAESDFPIALQGDSVEFWLEDMEIEVTGLPDNEYCIANVENISYTWMVNENVYGSGSQATVNSAAPGGTHTGHDTLETLGVHKIAFSGAGNVDVFYEANNAGIVHLGFPISCYAEANFGIAKLILVTPHGDPVNQPYAATGPYDGVPTCNEFFFDSSTNGVLGMRLMAEVQPLEIRQYFNVGDVSFTIDSVGNAAPSYSASRWSPEPDVVWRRYILCDATIIGLPANNSDFGLKTARMYYKGSLVAENNYEVFYTATANNHPSCTLCLNCPNWFYYYKQASGGGSYTYDSSLSTSQSISGGGESTIRIANNAYSGGCYYKTIYDMGLLKVTGISSINKYYPHFCGVIAHERQHANNECYPASIYTDSDMDYLKNDYELYTSHTKPNKWDSALSQTSDAEAYANGPVEQLAIQSADSSKDWAFPGSNSQQINNNN